MTGNFRIKPDKKYREKKKKRKAKLNIKKKVKEPNVEKTWKPKEKTQIKNRGKAETNIKNKY